MFLLQGFSILFCFVVKAEVNFKSKPMNKKTIKHGIEDYCSASINSPLNCKFSLCNVFST